MGTSIPLLSDQRSNQGVQQTEVLISTVCSLVETNIKTFVKALDRSFFSNQLNQFIGLVSSYLII